MKPNRGLWVSGILGVLLVSLIVGNSAARSVWNTVTVQDSPAIMGIRSDPEIQFFLHLRDVLPSTYPASTFLGTFGDLDNDNATLESIWANSTLVFALNASGSLLWSVDGLLSPIYYQRVAIGDFDRDGYTDDFYDLGFHAYNSTGQWITQAVNGTRHYENFSCSIGYCAVGDLNRDGYADDIVLDVDLKDGRYIFAFPYLSMNGSFPPECAFWNFSVGDPIYADAFTLGDFDSDGFPDDVVFATDLCTYALNGSGAILWTFPKALSAPPLTADFDGDGVPNEVALLTDDGYLCVIDADGNPLWNVSNATEHKWPALADLDNDGIENELVFVWNNSRTLMAYDNNGTRLWSWERSGDNYGLGTITSITIADLDGDSYQDEVLACCGHVDELYAFNHLGTLIGIGQVDVFLPLSYFGDLDGDGCPGDFITGGYGMHFYRLGQPHLQCAIATCCTPHTFAEGWQPIHCRFDSQEPYPLSILMTPQTPTGTPDDSVPLPVDVLSFAMNQTGYALVELYPGTYNLTVDSSYYGIVLTTLVWQVSVTADSTIGSPFILIFCIVALAISVGWRQRKFLQ